MFHLKKETCQFLDHQSNTLDLLIVYNKPGIYGSYGYFILVDGWDDDDQENINKIPNDLKECLEYASRENCSYLMFDIDGYECEELKLFEWE